MASVPGVVVLPGLPDPRSDRHPACGRHQRRPVCRRRRPARHGPAVHARAGPGRLRDLRGVLPRHPGADDDVLRLLLRSVRVEDLRQCAPSLRRRGRSHLLQLLRDRRAGAFRGAQPAPGPAGGRLGRRTHPGSDPDRDPAPAGRRGHAALDRQPAGRDLEGLGAGVCRHLSRAAPLRSEPGDVQGQPDPDLHRSRAHLHRHQLGPDPGGAGPGGPAAYRQARDQARSAEPRQPTLAWPPRKSRRKRPRPDPPARGRRAGRGAGRPDRSVSRGRAGRRAAGRRRSRRCTGPNRA